jgi:hypothetical protein
MSIFQRTHPKPLLRSEARLSRGTSVLVIGVLSALSWAVLVAIIVALRAAL